MSKKTFNIQEFRELFEQTAKNVSFSKMTLKKINEAIVRKDERFLAPFFELFNDLKAREEEIAADFVKGEKKIMDKLGLAFSKIKKNYVEKPARLKREKKEAAEERAAEKILQQLDQ